MTPLDRLRALHAAVLATGEPLNPRYTMGKLLACVDALVACADALEHEIRCRYQAFPDESAVHPAMRVKFDQDMQEVIDARAALAPLVKEEP